MGRYVLLAFCVACAPAVHAPAPQKVALAHSRATKPDSDLVEWATLSLVARRYAAPSGIAALRAYRARAPNGEVPLVDELLTLFGKPDESDTDCLPITRSYAARYPNDFAFQWVHLSLLQAAVFVSPRALIALPPTPEREELKAFATQLVTRFPHEWAPYVTLAKMCEREQVLPQDEESHARECLASYATCLEQTKHRYCDARADELRALASRPACHGENIATDVHIRYGFDAPFNGGVALYADGRETFAEPTDAYAWYDFVRIVANGSGAVVHLTSGARKRAQRIGDVALIMKGDAVVESVRGFESPRDVGTFALTDTGVQRLCARIEQTP